MTNCNEPLGEDSRVEKWANEEPFPPRRKVHPSNKLQMARLFYNTLIVLFLVLTAGLIIWGIQFLE